MRMFPAWWLFGLCFGHWVGTCLGSDWEDVDDDQGRVIAVEPVVSRTYHLPVEVNQDPYTLVEWNTDPTGRRRAYPFPPGLLFGGALALVALLLILKSDPKRLVQRLAGRAPEPDAEDGPDKDVAKVGPQGTLSPEAAEHLGQLFAMLEEARMDTVRRKAALLTVEGFPEAFDRDLYSIVSEKLEMAAERTADLTAELQSSLSDNALLYVERKAKELQMSIQKLKDEEALENIEVLVESLLNEELSKGDASRKPEGAEGGLSEAAQTISDFLLSLAALRDLVLEAAPEVAGAALGAPSGSQ